MAYDHPDKQKAYVKKNAEKIAAYQKKYQMENKETIMYDWRLAEVKRRYNLDADDYLKLIQQQENKCAICFKQETVKNRSGDVRPLCVDHDHSTGAVRALLCNRCNSCLGYINDSVEILESAIQYLNRYKEA